MTKSIVITGASKGIGRAAADALAEQGWTVIGVARSAPQCFPGEFISADLGDQDQTGALANELAARGNVLGIVNNVGLAKHETIDAVELRVFTAVMDLNVRPALQLTPLALIEGSHVWQALYLANKMCEQRRGIISSPRESQRQRHVQIDHR